MPFLRRCRLLFALFVGLVLGQGPVWAGDGNQEWRTLQTPHFLVHFYLPYEDVAQRIGVVAEASYGELKSRYGHESRERIHIVLRDTTDSANGSAQIVPRNHIELFVSSPRLHSGLANHDDWYFTLTHHELAHVVHLGQVGGPARVYNRIFGPTWAPNRLTPGWIIEGIATHEETRATSEGRGRNDMFHGELRTAILSHDFHGLDTASTSPRRPPGSNTRYLYGGHFFDYLKARFGDDLLPRFGEEHGKTVIPWAVGRSMERVYGKSAVVLWDDWQEYLWDRYQLDRERAERRGIRRGTRLTVSGHTNHFPRYSKDGRFIYWVRGDGYDSTALYRMRRTGTMASPQRVAHYSGIRRFALKGDGKIVMEQPFTSHGTYTYREISMAQIGERAQRLTHGARSRDPALSSDGVHVAFSANKKGNSELAVGKLGPEMTWRQLGTGKFFENVFAPAWSPDGKQIAFVGRNEGQTDIAVIDLEDGSVKRLTEDRALDMDPVFSSDGKHLFFSSNRSGIFNVFAVDLETRRVSQVTNVLGAALSPTVSPDGQYLAYQLLTYEGWDLYELPLNPNEWLSARPYVGTRPLPKKYSSEHPFPVSHYRPLESLAPRAYQLELETGRRRQLRFLTNGSDATDRHAYSFVASSSIDDPTLNVVGSYSYSGLWPRLSGTVSRQRQVRGGLSIDGVPDVFAEELHTLDGSISLPVLRKPGYSVTWSFGFGGTFFHNVGGDFPIPSPDEQLPDYPETDMFIGGARTAVSYRDVESATYTPGPVEGTSVRLSVAWQDPRFGARYRSLEFRYTWEQYWKLPFGQTTVLYSRLRGGVRGNNRPTTAPFVLGGIPDQDVIDALVQSARFSSTGYLRGFVRGDLRGTTFHLLNLEYRQHLLEIEKGLETLPLFVRTVSWGMLFDGASAHTEGWGAENLRASLGAALRLDFVLGYYVPGTLDIGVSRGLTSTGITEFWTLITATL